MRGRGAKHHGGAAGDYQRRMMEEQNNHAQSALADQISALKGISRDILSEVEAQNELLDNMSGQVSSTSSMLNDTIGKLGSMLKTGGGSHMLALTVFIVVAFILIYSFLM